MESKKNSNSDLEYLFKKKVFKYSNKGGSFTNHLLIQMLNFIVYKCDDFGFFSKIQQKYKCFLDTMFFRNYCMEYLLKNQFKTSEIYNLNKIRNLLSLHDETKIKKLDVYGNNMSSFYELIIKVPFEINDDKKYHDFCLNILRDIKNENFTTDEQILMGLSKAKFVTGFFDIECGWINNIAHKEFVTPITGYVQSISLILDIYSGSGYEKTPRAYIYCFIDPKFLDYGNYDVKKCFYDLKKRIKMVNLDIMIFKSELDMINSFFNHSSTMDILFGYNSKRFDLPFLVHRANILKNGDIFEQKYLNSYLFCSNYRFKINSSKLVNLKAKCKKCSKLIAYNKNNPKVFNCMICNNVQEAKADGNLVLNIYKDCDEDLPFSFHCDLFLNKQMRGDLENSRLETVTNFHLKKKVGNILRLDGNVFIMLHDRVNADNIESIFRVFFKNSKIVLFKIKSDTKEISNKNELRLDKIFVCREGNIAEISNIDNFYSHEKFDHVNIPKGVTLSKKSGVKDDFCVFLKAKQCDTFNFIIDSESYVSIGKTSEMSIDESMKWKSVDDVINTIEYNLYDSIITAELEFHFVSLSEINMSVRDFMCVFQTLSKTVAKKTEFTYLFKLIPTDFIFMNYTFDQYNSFFNIPMKVECFTLKECIKRQCLENLKETSQEDDNVKCKDDGSFSNVNLYKIDDAELNKLLFRKNLNVITGDNPIVSLPCMTSPKEYFNQDSMLISNEHFLKISGEYDCSDKDLVYKNMGSLTL